MSILLPVMYDVPNDPTIIRVTIDKDTVEGGEAHLNTALCLGNL